jgi:hypothetical protein
MPNVSAIILAFLIAAAFITSYTSKQKAGGQPAHTVMLYR